MVTAIVQWAKAPGIYCYVVGGAFVSCSPKYIIKKFYCYVAGLIPTNTPRYFTKNIESVPDHDGGRRK